MIKRIITIAHSTVWWLWWGLVVLAGIFLDTVIWPGNRIKCRAAEHFWARTLMRLGGVKLEISGRENIPPNETVVYMPNHQSDLDWPIIFMSVPGLYLFVAKKELFDTPIFGTYLRIQNYIPIDRDRLKKSLKTYKDIVSLVERGNSIIIYPEGTRSYSKELQKFKAFSFAFLQEARVRVIPIAIDGSIDILKKGSMLIRPGKVKVTILPPVSLEDIYGMDTKCFCKEASERVRRSLLGVLEKTDIVRQAEEIVAR
jgi:1-acyl-sn-glycerol-3-phosphate acyltransferase